MGYLVMIKGQLNEAILWNQLHQNSRDIFAFTDRPYRKHAYMTGEQFASLSADSGSDSFKTDPPNAVLTWLDGDKVHEAEVVITDASVLAHGRAISFEVN